MVRFINFVNTVDKVTDCVPIVSTLKNGGIMLYQLVHKVNKSNPVKVSWKDDIKIHALSKHDFLAGLAAIPVLGNLTCLVKYVGDAIMGKKSFFAPKNPLKNVFFSSGYGVEKHSYEIASLYLARNRDLSETKLQKSLKLAAYAKGDELFQLILNSKESWSKEAVKGLLKSLDSETKAITVLEKHPNLLTEEDAAEIINSTRRYSLLISLSVVDVLMQKFPNMHPDHVGAVIVKLAGYREGSIKMIESLLQRFPAVGEEHRKAAMLRALEGRNLEIFKLIDGDSPGILEKYIGEMLPVAANNHVVVVLEWLETYKETITTDQVKMVLAAQDRLTHWNAEHDTLTIIEGILSNYTDFPADDLVFAMEKAATFNPGLFKSYLEKFTQLEPKHLQAILDKSANLYKRFSSTSMEQYKEHHGKIVEFILERFPDMKADPHFWLSS